MPQLSLYLDADTMKAVETKAKQKNLSLSKYVQEAIRKDVSTDWPVGFFDLFGSIKDSTFTLPDQLNFNDDRTPQSWD
ncbi:MAG: toxin-antitoxin system, antitoxin component [Leptospiraceae bacterium]|nr:toxin-antitoxin system, antitoxin component [Leptospiraceae bacterium]